MYANEQLLSLLLLCILLPGLNSYFRNTLHTVKEMSSEKQVIFLRHSTTVNNEYLRQHSPKAWGGDEEFFQDPGLIDTSLSEAGIELVRDLNKRLRAPGGEQLFDRSKVDLVAVSPMRRTLQTASIGLEGVLLSSSNSPSQHTPPVIVCPLARERLYMQADQGRPRSVLEKEFPAFSDFSALPADDSPWW